MKASVREWIDKADAAFRYPGESATREMAKSAVRQARQVRKRMRSDMGLPEE